MNIYFALCVGWFIFLSVRSIQLYSQAKKLNLKKIVHSIGGSGGSIIIEIDIDIFENHSFFVLVMHVILALSFPVLAIGILYAFLGNYNHVLSIHGKNKGKYK